MKKSSVLAPGKVENAGCCSHGSYIRWYFKIGARVWSDLGYLICLRHLFRSRIVKNKEKTDCSSSMRKRSELSSNITAMVDQEYFNVTVLSIQISRSQCALSLFSLFRILRIQDCTTINLIFKCYSCLNSLFIYSFKSVDECNSLFPWTLFLLYRLQ